MTPHFQSTRAQILSRCIDQPDPQSPTNLRIRSSGPTRCSSRRNEHCCSSFVARMDVTVVRVLRLAPQFPQLNRFKCCIRTDRGKMFARWDRFPGRLGSMSKSRAGKQCPICNSGFSSSFKFVVGQRYVCPVCDAVLTPCRKSNSQVDANTTASSESQQDVPSPITKMKRAQWTVKREANTSFWRLKHVWQASTQRQ